MGQQGLQVLLLLMMVLLVSARQPTVRVSMGQEFVLLLEQKLVLPLLKLLMLVSAAQSTIVRLDAGQEPETSHMESLSECSQFAVLLAAAAGPCCCCFQQRTKRPKLVWRLEAGQKLVQLLHSTCWYHCHYCCCCCRFLQRKHLRVSVEI